IWLKETGDGIKMRKNIFFGLPEVTMRLGSYEIKIKSFDGETCHVEIGGFSFYFQYERKAGKSPAVRHHGSDKKIELKRGVRYEACIYWDLRPPQEGEIIIVLGLPILSRNEWDVSANLSAGPPFRRRRLFSRSLADNRDKPFDEERETRDWLFNVHQLDTIELADNKIVMKEKGRHTELNNHFQVNGLSTAEQIARAFFYRVLCWPATTDNYKHTHGISTSYLWNILEMTGDQRLAGWLEKVRRAYHDLEPMRLFRNPHSFITEPKLNKVAGFERYWKGFQKAAYITLDLGEYLILKFKLDETGKKGIIPKGERDRLLEVFKRTREVFAGAQLITLRDRLLGPINYKALVKNQAGDIDEIPKKATIETGLVMDQLPFIENELKKIQKDYLEYKKRAERQAGWKRLADQKMEEAKTIINMFFENQQTMWERGVIDRAPDIMQRYGLGLWHGEPKVLGVAPGSLFVGVEARAIVNFLTVRHKETKLDADAYPEAKEYGDLSGYQKQYVYNVDNDTDILGQVPEDFRDYYVHKVKNIVPKDEAALEGVKFEKEWQKAVDKGTERQFQNAGVSLSILQNEQIGHMEWFVAFIHMKHLGEEIREKFFGRKSLVGTPQLDFAAAFSGFLPVDPKNGLYQMMQVYLARLSKYPKWIDDLKKIKDDRLWISKTVLEAVLMDIPPDVIRSHWEDKIFTDFIKDSVTLPYEWTEKPGEVYPVVDLDVMQALHARVAMVVKPILRSKFIYPRLDAFLNKRGYKGTTDDFIDGLSMIWLLIIEIPGMILISLFFAWPVVLGVMTFMILIHPILEQFDVNRTRGSPGFLRSLLGHLVVFGVYFLLSPDFLHSILTLLSLESFAPLPFSWASRLFSGYGVVLLVAAFLHLRADLIRVGWGFPYRLKNNHFLLQFSGSVIFLFLLFGLGYELIGLWEAPYINSELNLAMSGLWVPRDRGPIWEQSEDLKDLKTDPEKTKKVASILKGVLDEIRFDEYNQLLRDPEKQGDYHASPLARHDVVRDDEVVYEELRKMSFEERPDDKNLRRVYYAFGLLVFGDTLTRVELDELLGVTSESVIQDFMDVGIIVHTGFNKYETNGLSLVSRELLNKEVIYTFVDTPPTTKIRPSLSGRVYAGSDSIQLLNYLQQGHPFSGIGIDFGAGQGIQSIGILKTYSAVDAMILYEIDARARNVSFFNAHLNGCEKKIIIAKDKSDIRDALKKQQVDRASFGVSNPPFNPIPEKIQTFLGELDLRNKFFKAGWGGTDGLFVIREFMDLASHFIKDGGPFVLYSAVWTGNDKGPNKIIDLAANRGWEAKFVEQDPFKLSLKKNTEHIEGNVMTVEDLSEIMMNGVIDSNPEFLTERKSLEPYSSEFLRQYKELDITHVYIGFVNLTVRPTSDEELEKGVEITGKTTIIEANGENDESTEIDDLGSEGEDSESETGPLDETTMGELLRILPGSARFLIDEELPRWLEALGSGEQALDEVLKTSHMKLREGQREKVVKFFTDRGMLSIMGRPILRSRLFYPRIKTVVDSTRLNGRTDEVIEVLSWISLLSMEIPGLVITSLFFGWPTVLAVMIFMILIHPILEQFDVNRTRGSPGFLRSLLGHLVVFGVYFLLSPEFLNAALPLLSIPLPAPLPESLVARLFSVYGFILIYAALFHLGADLYRARSTDSSLPQNGSKSLFGLIRVLFVPPDHEMNALIGRIRKKMEREFKGHFDWNKNHHVSLVSKNQRSEDPLPLRHVIEISEAADGNYHEPDEDLYFKGTGGSVTEKTIRINLRCSDKPALDNWRGVSGDQRKERDYHITLGWKNGTFTAEMSERLQGILSEFEQEIKNLPKLSLTTAPLVYYEDLIFHNVRIVDWRLLSDVVRGKFGEIDVSGQAAFFGVSPRLVNSSINAVRMEIEGVLRFLFNRYILEPIPQLIKLMNVILVLFPSILLSVTLSWLGIDGVAEPMASMATMGLGGFHDRKQNADPPKLTSRMAVSKLLDQLNLSDFDGLPMQTLADEEGWQRQVTVKSREDTDELPRTGMEVVQEVLGTNEFAFLYDQNRFLKAIIPSDSSIEKYVDLSPYYIEVPNVGDPREKEVWEEYIERRETDEKLINKFIHQHYGSRSRDVEKIEDGGPFAYVEIEKATGQYISYGYDPVKREKKRSREYRSDLEQFILPVFPTVFSPGRIHHAGLDKMYMEAIYEKLEEGDSVLVGGPGAGPDSWIAWLKTKGKIHAFGINPFEIANLQATAVIAGFEVETTLADNIVTEDGVNVFTGKKFKWILWNMPQYEEQRYIPGNMMGRWDQDYLGKILRRFAKGVVSSLVKGGKALVWNGTDLEPWRPIMKILQTNGEWEFGSDKVVSPASDREVERLSDHVYLVTKTHEKRGWTSTASWLLRNATSILLPLVFVGVLTASLSAGEVVSDVISGLSTVNWVPVLAQQSNLGHSVGLGLGIYIITAVPISVLIDLLIIRPNRFPKIHGIFKKPTEKREKGKSGIIKLVIPSTFLQNLAMFLVFPIQVVSQFVGGDGYQLDALTLFALFVMSLGGLVYSIWYFSVFWNMQRKRIRRDKEDVTEFVRQGFDLESILPFLIIAVVGSSMFGLFVSSFLRPYVLVAWVLIVASVGLLAVHPNIPMGSFLKSKKIRIRKIKKLMRVMRLVLIAANLTLLLILAQSVILEELLYWLFVFTALYSIYEFLQNFVVQLSSIEYAFLWVLHPVRVLLYFLFGWPMATMRFKGGVIGKHLDSGQKEDAGILELQKRFKKKYGRDISPILVKSGVMKFFSIDSSESTLLIKGVHVLRQLHKTDDGDLFKPKAEILEDLVDYLRFIKWPTTNTHRLLPLALAVSNHLEGRDIFSMDQTNALDQIEQEALKELFDIDGPPYFAEVYPLTANPNDVSTEWFPPQMTLMIEKLLKDQTGSYQWLDVGSSPGAKGAPSLLVLERIFEKLGIPMEMTSTDIGFPMVTYDENGFHPNPFYSSDFMTSSGRTKVDGSEISYANARLAQFDVMSPDFNLRGFDFISVCFVLHHLRDDQERGEPRILARNVEWLDDNGLPMETGPQYDLTETQQVVVERLMGGLNDGGILFLTATEKGKVDWSNVQFLMVQKETSNRFRIYSQAIPMHPRREVYYSMKYLRKPTKYHSAIGLRGLYPGAPDTFFDEIATWFHRADIVGIFHQKRGRSIWTRLKEAGDAIDQGQSLLDIMMTYLKDVPDDDSRKEKILKGIHELQLKGEEYKTRKVGQGIPSAIGYYAAKWVGLSHKNAVRWGWVSMILEAALLLSLPFGLREGGILRDLIIDGMPGLDWPVSILMLIIVVIITFVHPVLRMMLGEHRIRGEPLLWFVLKAFVIHFIVFLPYLLFSLSVVYPLEISSLAAAVSLVIGIYSVLFHAGFDDYQMRRRYQRAVKRDIWLWVFDKDDTLAESMEPIKDDTKNLLLNLVNHVEDVVLGIVSGGSVWRIDEHVTDRVHSDVKERMHVYGQGGGIGFSPNQDREGDPIYLREIKKELADSYADLIRIIKTTVMRGEIASRLTDADISVDSELIGEKQAKINMLIPTVSQELRNDIADSINKAIEEGFAEDHPARKLIVAATRASIEITIANKAESLWHLASQVAEERGVSPQEVLAHTAVLGDSAIDIPMLNLAAQFGGSAIWVGDKPHAELDRRVTLYPVPNESGVQQLLQHHMRWLGQRFSQWNRGLRACRWWFAVHFPKTILLLMMLFQLHANGRVPVAASDLNRTLVHLGANQDESYLYPTTQSMVKDTLQTGPFYVVTGDPMKNAREEFYDKLKDNLSEEERKNLYLITTAGSDLHEYRNGFYEATSLVPGLNVDEVRIIEEVISGIRSDEILHNFHRENSQGENPRSLEPFEAKEGVVLTYWPAGKMSPEGEKEFERDSHNQELMVRIVREIQTKLHERGLTHIQIRSGSATGIDLITSNKGNALGQLVQAHLNGSEYFVFLGDRLVSGGNDEEAMKAALLNVYVGEKENKDPTLPVPSGHHLVFAKKPAEKGSTAEYLQLVNFVRCLSGVQHSLPSRSLRITPAWSGDPDGMLVFLIACLAWTLRFLFKDRVELRTSFHVLPESEKEPTYVDEGPMTLDRDLFAGWYLRGLNRRAYLAFRSGRSSPIGIELLEDLEDAAVNLREEFRSLQTRRYVALTHLSAGRYQSGIRFLRSNLDFIENMRQSNPWYFHKDEIDKEEENTRILLAQLLLKVHQREEGIRVLSFDNGKSLRPILQDSSFAQSLLKQLKEISPPNNDGGGHFGLFSLLGGLILVGYLVSSHAFEGSGLVSSSSAFVPLLLSVLKNPQFPDTSFGDMFWRLSVRFMSDDGGSISYGGGEEASPLDSGEREIDHFRAGIFAMLLPDLFEATSELLPQIEGISNLGAAKRSVETWEEHREVMIERLELIRDVLSQSPSFEEDKRIVKLDSELKKYGVNDGLGYSHFEGILMEEYVKAQSLCYLRLMASESRRFLMAEKSPRSELTHPIKLAQLVQEFLQTMSVSYSKVNVAEVAQLENRLAEFEKQLGEISGKIDHKENLFDIKTKWLMNPSELKSKVKDWLPFLDRYEQVVLQLLAGYQTVKKEKYSFEDVAELFGISDSILQEISLEAIERAEKGKVSERQVIPLEDHIDLFLAEELQIIPVGGEFGWREHVWQEVFVAFSGSLEESLHRFEKKVIWVFLEKNRGSRTQTAKELGITEQRLFKKMNKFSIVFPKRKEMEEEGVVSGRRPYVQRVENYEKVLIQRTIAQYEGHVDAVAKRLGVTPNTIQNKIREYNLARLVQYQRKKRFDKNRQVSKRGGKVERIVVTLHPDGTLSDIIKKYEMKIIIEALQQSRGNVRQASIVLNINPKTLKRRIKAFSLEDHVEKEGSESTESNNNPFQNFDQAVSRFEAILIDDALKWARGDVPKAADELQIHSQTLYKKMSRYGIENPRTARVAARLEAEQRDRKAAPPIVDNKILSLAERVHKFKKDLVYDMLLIERGNRTRTAHRLKTTKTTILNLIQTYSIDVPYVYQGRVKQSRRKEFAESESAEKDEEEETISLAETVRAYEESIIRRTLNNHNGNRNYTARRLRIHRNTLKEKMEKYGITFSKKGKPGPRKKTRKRTGPSLKNTLSTLFVSLLIYLGILVLMGIDVPIRSEHLSFAGIFPGIAFGGRVPWYGLFAAGFVEIVEPFFTNMAKTHPTKLMSLHYEMDEDEVQKQLQQNQWAILILSGLGYVILVLGAVFLLPYFQVELSPSESLLSSLLISLGIVSPLIVHQFIVNGYRYYTGGVLSSKKVPNPTKKEIDGNLVKELWGQFDQVPEILTLAKTLLSESQLRTLIKYYTHLGDQIGSVQEGGIKVDNAWRSHLTYILAYLALAFVYLRPERDSDDTLTPFSLSVSESTASSHLEREERFQYVVSLDPGESPQQQIAQFTAQIVAHVLRDEMLYPEAKFPPLPEERRELDEGLGRLLKNLYAVAREQQTSLLLQDSDQPSERGWYSSMIDHIHAWCLSFEDVTAHVRDFGQMLIYRLIPQEIEAVDSSEVLKRVTGPPLKSKSIPRAKKMEGRLLIYPKGMKRESISMQRVKTLEVGKENLVAISPPEMDPPQTLAVQNRQVVIMSPKGAYNPEARPSFRPFVSLRYKEGPNAALVFNTGEETAMAQATAWGSTGFKNWATFRHFSWRDKPTEEENGHPQEILVENSKIPTLLLAPDEMALPLTLGLKPDEPILLIPKGDDFPDKIQYLEMPGSFPLLMTIKPRKKVDYSDRYVWAPNRITQVWPEPPPQKEKEETETDVPRRERRRSKPGVPEHVPPLKVPQPAHVPAPAPFRQVQGGETPVYGNMGSGVRTDRHQAQRSLPPLFPIALLLTYLIVSSVFLGKGDVAEGEALAEISSIIQLFFGNPPPAHGEQASLAQELFHQSDEMSTQDIEDLVDLLDQGRINEPEAIRLVAQIIKNNTKNISFDTALAILELLANQKIHLEENVHAWLTEALEQSTQFVYPPLDGMTQIERVSKLNVLIPYLEDQANINQAFVLMYRTMEFYPETRVPTSVDMLAVVLSGNFKGEVEGPQCMYAYELARRMKHPSPYLINLIALGLKHTVDDEGFPQKSALDFVNAHRNLLQSDGRAAFRKLNTRILLWGSFSARIRIIIRLLKRLIPHFLILMILVIPIILNGSNEPPGFLNDLINGGMGGENLSLAAFPAFVTDRKMDPEEGEPGRVYIPQDGDPTPDRLAIPLNKYRNSKKFFGRKGPWHGILTITIDRHIQLTLDKLNLPGFFKSRVVSFDPTIFQALASHKGNRILAIIVEPSDKERIVQEFKKLRGWEIVLYYVDTDFDEWIPRIEEQLGKIKQADEDWVASADRAHETYEKAQRIFSVAQNPNDDFVYLYEKEVLEAYIENYRKSLVSQSEDRIPWLWSDVAHIDLCIERILERREKFREGERSFDTLPAIPRAIVGLVNRGEYWFPTVYNFTEEDINQEHLGKFVKHFTDPRTGVLKREEIRSVLNSRTEETPLQKYLIPDEASFIHSLWILRLVILNDPVLRSSESDATSAQDKYKFRQFGQSDQQFYPLGIRALEKGRNDNRLYQAYARLRDPQGRLFLDTTKESEKGVAAFFNRNRDLVEKTFVTATWDETTSGDSTVQSMGSSLSQSASRLGKVNLFNIRLNTGEVLENSLAATEMKRMKTDGEVEFIGLVAENPGILRTSLEKGLLAPIDVIQLPAKVFVDNPTMARDLYHAGKAIVLTQPHDAYVDEDEDSSIERLLQRAEVSLILTDKNKSKSLSTIINTVYRFFASTASLIIILTLIGIVWLSGNPSEILLRALTSEGGYSVSMAGIGSGDSVYGWVIGMVGMAGLFGLIHVFSGNPPEDWPENSLLNPQTPDGVIFDVLGLNDQHPINVKNENGFWIHELTVNDDQRRQLNDIGLPALLEGDDLGANQPNIGLLCWKTMPMILYSEGLPRDVLPLDFQKENQFHPLNLMAAQIQNTSYDNVRYAVGLNLRFEDENVMKRMKEDAESWWQQNVKSSRLVSTPLVLGYVTLPDESQDRIYYLRESYKPIEHPTILMLTGLRPRENAVVVELGAGTIPAGKLASTLAKQVIAMDRSVVDTLLNARLARYADKISVVRIDLLEDKIADALQDVKPDVFYINPPLALFQREFPSTFEKTLWDPNMVLLKEILSQVDPYIQGDVTLEGPYLEIPEYFHEIYSRGLEPTVMEGTHMSYEWRKKVEPKNRQASDYDYSRMIIRRQNNQLPRTWPMEELLEQWQLLIDAKSELREDGEVRPERRNQLNQLRERLERELPQSDDFDGKLLYKVLVDVMRVIRIEAEEIEADEPFLQVPDVRVNERFEEYEAELGVKGEDWKINFGEVRYSPLLMALVGDQMMKGLGLTPLLEGIPGYVVFFVLVGIGIWIYNNKRKTLEYPSVTVIPEEEGHEKLGRLLSKVLLDRDHLGMGGETEEKRKSFRHILREAGLLHMSDDDIVLIDASKEHQMEAIINGLNQVAHQEGNMLVVVQQASMEEKVDQESLHPFLTLVNAGPSGAFDGGDFYLDRLEVLPKVQAYYLKHGKPTGVNIVKSSGIRKVLVRKKNLIKDSVFRNIPARVFKLEVLLKILNAVKILRLKDRLKPTQLIEQAA
ncbi:hypothetical protein BVX98_00490, partial [bacterium F11]